MGKRQICLLLNLVAVLELAYGTSLSPLRRQLRKKTSSTTTTTERNYIFEGLDYDELPEDLREENVDCFGQEIRCIRARTFFVPVCGYDTTDWWYRDYYSICQLDLDACQLRMNKGFGVYGTNRHNNRIFYNGEDLDCVYYYRRSNSIEDLDRLYFGGDPPFNRTAESLKTLEPKFAQARSASAIMNPKIRML